MISFFSEEKRREKKAEWAVAICYEYTDICVEAICYIKGAVRASKERIKTGRDIKLKPVSVFDSEVLEAVGRDDSIHFWYSFGFWLARHEELGDEFGLLLAVRILLEFLHLEPTDSVLDLGEKRQKEAERKIKNGEKDRIVKIEYAANLAAAGISKIRGMTAFALDVYQDYINEYVYYDNPSENEKFKKLDLIIEEQFFD